MMRMSNVFLSWGLRPFAIQYITAMVVSKVFSVEVAIL